MKQLRMLIVVLCFLMQGQNAFSEDRTPKAMPEKEITEERSLPSKTISLIPYLGMAGYLGKSDQGSISNSYIMGMALEIPVSQYFALELEGGCGENTITYDSKERNFSQLNTAVHFKISRPRGVFRPFTGLGFNLLYYDNIIRNEFDIADKIIWAFNFHVGAMAQLSPAIGIGVRGTFSTAIFKSNISGTGYFHTKNAFDTTPMSILNEDSYFLSGIMRISF